MAKTVYFVEKGWYDKDGNPRANGVRGPNGQKLTGPFDLSLSPAASAAFRKGVTNGKATGSHKNVASSGRIKKVQLKLRIENVI